MTNGDKYKTAQERAEAFWAFCEKHQDDCSSCPLWNNCNADYKSDQFAWLDLEAEEEKPLPCPFCGGECKTFVVFEPNTHCVVCDGCGYSSAKCKCETEAIAAHNRVAKAVKESEVKE